MSENPDREPTVKYARGQAPSEEMQQTREMPRSRIRHGAVVATIAIILVIVIAVLLAL